ncbi:MAG TPA: DUF885 domain-containing protein [Acidimicrobiales bacterium]|nr:DUF885 domain-containing protein [Acidimicrobiales bacterium]
MADETQRSELFANAHDFIERSAALDPLAATAYGIDRYDDRLTDFSLAHAAETREFLRSSLTALAAIVPTDDIDRIGQDVMAERLTATLGLEESGETRRVFSVLGSPASAIRQVFEIQPATTAEHAEKIRDRLAGVGAALESWRGALDEDSQHGLVAARRQALGVAGQLETYSAGAFTERAGRAARSCAVDPETSGLLAAAADADRASGELSGWLRSVYARRATEDDAVGAERYRPWAQYFTGAELDLVEIQQWGWADLTRINARMWEIAADIAPEARRLVEVADLLDADEDHAVHGTDALLHRLRSMTEGAVEMLDGVHFDIDERVRFCDARLAPEGSAAAPYYISPSEDLSRPGTTWFPTLGHDRFSLWRLVSTWYHESVPGHHLQIATAMLERDRQSRFQRLEGFVSGYGEGWALYAERLMEELGAYTDPADEMGYLSCQALRAARIVVDIGMHLQLPAPADIGELAGLGDVAGRPWDVQMAVALLEERAIEPHDMATSEVDRYLGLPGQAISYKVGERVWLETRSEARRRLGPAFDLKAWHAHALALGPMGLDPFRREMAAYGH